MRFPRLPSAAFTDVIFFPVIYFLAALWLDPVLFYNLPQFDVLPNLPSYPGKPVDAGALFLISHFYGNPWAGAFVITLALFAASRLTFRLLTGSGGRVPGELAYLPAIFMLFQCAREMRALQEGISFVAGLLAVWICQTAGRRSTALRVTMYTLSAGLVFAIAPGGYVLFAASCALSELAVNRNYAAAAVEVIVAAAAPAIVTVCFFPSSTIEQAYSVLRNLLPSGRTVTSWLAQGTFLTVFISSAVFSRKGGTASVTLLSGAKGGPERPSGRKGNIIRGLAAGAMIAGLAAVALRTGTGSDFRRYAALNRAMLSENWDRILAVGRGAKPASLSIIEVHLIDRALYKKGRLLDELFQFPQDRRTLLLDIDDNTIPAGAYFWKHAFAGGTFLDLGLVSAAENSAREVVTQGYRPGLKVLSIVYAVKDMPEPAGICLKALQRGAVFRSSSNDRTSALETGTGLSGTPEVKRLRALSLKNDRLRTAESPLDDLLRENPPNRMAFEYRVAERLLEDDLGSIEGDAALFRALRYPRLPRLFEEAVLFRTMLTEGKPDLAGYSISNESMTAFRGFFSVLVEKHGGRLKEAYPELARSYRDSYFFYRTYFAPRKKAGL